MSLKKRPKQQHHFILGLNTPKKDEFECKFTLSVNRTIQRSKLSPFLKAQYTDLLRVCLTTNRQFIKDIRAAKKPMMINEKLMEERWNLHHASLKAIKDNVNSHGMPPILAEEETLTDITSQLEFC